MRELDDCLRMIAGAAQRRARERELAIDADLYEQVRDLFHSQSGRCAHTGLPFDLRQVGQDRARRPFAPSVDRVDPTSGYTRDNVRPVCQVVNFALNAYGEDVFYEMCRAATAYVGEMPQAIADENPEDERQRKVRYIGFRRR